MGTTEELRVMGMAMAARVLRICPARSGLSSVGASPRPLLQAVVADHQVDQGDKAGWP